MTDDGKPGLFPAGGHDHHACVEAALASAELLCREHGLRLTPLRRRVLELVWRSHRPVGAYAVLEELRRDGRSAAPPTVYRALDFLVQERLVHRLPSLNAYIGCNEPGAPHCGQFLICRHCGRVAELHDHALDRRISASAADTRFRVEQALVEVQGLCPRCQAAEGEGE